MFFTQMLGVPEIEQMAHMKTRFRKVGGLQKEGGGDITTAKRTNVPLKKGAVSSGKDRLPTIRWEKNCGWDVGCV